MVCFLARCNRRCTDKFGISKTMSRFSRGYAVSLLISGRDMFVSCLLLQAAMVRYPSFGTRGACAFLAVYRVPSLLGLPCSGELPSCVNSYLAAPIFGVHDPRRYCPAVCIRKDEIRMERMVTALHKDHTNHVITLIEMHASQAWPIWCSDALVSI